MKQIRLIGTNLLILGAMISCGAPKKDDKNQKQETEIVEKVAVLPVEKKLTGRTIEYPCTLNPFEDNYLAPASAGRIEKIYVEVGSKVTKGQVIAQMDRTQLVQAETNMKTLELDYIRLDTLSKLGSVAKQQYDQIKGQYDVAKTNVAFLKENTQLTAPFAGVVSEKFFEDGEMFSGTPGSAGKAAIVHLIQVDNLKAFVSIPEKYLPAIKQGMTVSVDAEIYENEKFEGTVFRIHPTIDPSSHTFQVEIKIPNSKNLLRPGMYSHISMELSKDDALIVPAAAVLKLQGSNDRYVFIVKDGKAKRVSTQLGRRFDDYVEIIADEVKEGDTIVIKGQARLFDGVKVEIVSQQNAE
ncbi:MAG: efflux RND transporter periplasmic adaptor subunit [Prevotellaceae bacterium]|nr:efflux RND transporter periplasmic adaptor subunit [Prevotellaceae bacterium]